MRWLQCLAVLSVAALASAAGWQANYRVAATLAFLAAVVAPAILICGGWTGARRWLGHVTGVSCVALVAISGVARPGDPSLGYWALIACHAIAVGAYGAYLVRVLYRSNVRQKVEESFMRLDLWWVNAGLVAFVFVFAITAMQQGVASNGLLASLRRGLLPLSGVFLFLTAVHATEQGDSQRPHLLNRLLPAFLLAACLAALALPVLRGGLAWRAIERAQWHEAMGNRKEAFRHLEAAERHNAKLRWPEFRRRRTEIAIRLDRD